jgi:hypothetical protein
MCVVLAKPRAPFLDYDCLELLANDFSIHSRKAKLQEREFALPAHYAKRGSLPLRNSIALCEIEMLQNCQILDLTSVNVDWPWYCSFSTFCLTRAAFVTRFAIRSRRSKAWERDNGVLARQVNLSKPLLHNHETFVEQPLLPKAFLSATLQESFRTIHVKKL